MEQHLLRARQFRLTAFQRMNQVNALCIEGQKLCVDMQFVANFGFIAMHDVGFDGVITVATVQIGFINADMRKKLVGGLPKKIEISVLGHMAVIVDPFRDYTGVEQSQRTRPGRGRTIRCVEPGRILIQKCARAPAFALLLLG